LFQLGHAFAVRKVQPKIDKRKNKNNGKPQKYEPHVCTSFLLFTMKINTVEGLLIRNDFSQMSHDPIVKVQQMDDALATRLVQSQRKLLQEAGRSRSKILPDLRMEQASSQRRLPEGVVNRTEIQLKQKALGVCGLRHFPMFPTQFQFAQHEFIQRYHGAYGIRSDSCEVMQLVE
jgi:hypothetical protein